MKKLNLKNKFIVNARFLGCALLFLFDLSCKKPYDPPALKNAGNNLVVEGVINSGGDSTIITLSTTMPISNSLANLPVLRATVTVESNQNDVFKLTEAGNGKYVSPPLNINNQKQYRLHIITSDKQEYASDYVPVLTTPPIDSLGFNATSQGLVIYANAHDATGAVKYYRWDYDEEWEFHSEYNSQYIARGNEEFGPKDSLVERDQAHQIYYCFTGDRSSDIVLGSSVKLQQDVMYQAPIATIPTTSEKIEMEYSILVRQYAITADAYNFYTQLKKNTEQLGSIFDAQPSQITGNIHCLSDPSAAVVGFVSVNNIPSKRIFVHNTQLPATWVTQYPYYCLLDTAFNLVLTSRYERKVSEVEGDLIDSPRLALTVSKVPGNIGYTYSTSECTDCTIRGTTTVPAFWKY